MENLDHTNGEVKTFEIGDLKLQSGMTLKSARIVAKIFGSSSHPCIVFPTWYSGTHEDNGKRDIFHNMTE